MADEMRRLRIFEPDGTEVADALLARQIAGSHCGLNSVTAGCLLGQLCGLCQIRREQADSERLPAETRGRETSMPQAQRTTSSLNRCLAALQALDGQATTPQIRAVVNADGGPELPPGHVSAAMTALAKRATPAVRRAPDPGREHLITWLAVTEPAGERRI